MIEISDCSAVSINRVRTSNLFIIKSIRKGVKALTINDLKSNKYSLKDLLDNQDGFNFIDSLSLLATDSHIIIAATQNEC